MSELPVPTSLDPAVLAPGDRARAVAALLAAGLLRLRAPVTTSPPEGPDTAENTSELRANRLAVPPEKSVTVSAG
jgi:hypothetical protein